MPDDVRSEGDPEADVGVGLRRLREALATMDAQLTAVLARAATGREGFITREWGFITPGGLGVPLGGKFAPLEKRLADVADLVPDYQVAGVVTRRVFIKQNPEVVRGFVKAIAEAMIVFRNDPESVSKVMKERLKIHDPLVIAETQKDYPRYMPKVPYPSRAGIAVIKAFLDKNEPAVRSLSIDDQIDNQFVRELEQSGFFNSRAK